VSTRKRITEYLDIDIDRELWLCNRCGHEHGPARENYKRGLLVCARDPSEVHPPHFQQTEISHAPDADWCRIVEYYCAGCGTQVEVEYLPPGHPLTHDIELDLDDLKARAAS
jgi:acetone carboxylase, gamma subunit